MHMFVLVIHMTAYFCGIFIIELENEKRDLIAGAIDGFNELSTNGRKPKIHKIGVGALEVVHERTYADVFNQFTDVSFPAGLDVIDYSQKSGSIHIARLAGVGHTAVAETQCQIKAGENLKHAIVIADEVAQRVSGMIFLDHSYT